MVTDKLSNRLLWVDLKYEDVDLPEVLYIDVPQQPDKYEVRPGIERLGFLFSFNSLNFFLLYHPSILDPYAEDSISVSVNIIRGTADAVTVGKAALVFGDDTANRVLAEISMRKRNSGAS